MSSRNQPAILCFGRHLYTYGHAEEQGECPTMEDAVACVGDFAGSGSCYYGIFDGHGGVDAAKYAAFNIHRVFNRNYSGDVNIENTLKETIAEVNEYLVNMWPNQGTTCAIALVIKDYIYTANIGDTRILLIDHEGEIRQLSEDHKPTNRKEGDLIKSRGGFVLQGKTNGQLNLSRTLGDGKLKNTISAEPYTTVTHRKDGMVMVIASDPVWDQLDNDMVAKIASRHLTAQAAATAIKEEAVRRGANTNVSVIVVSLTPK